MALSTRAESSMTHINCVQSAELSCRCTAQSPYLLLCRSKQGVQKHAHTADQCTAACQPSDYPVGNGVQSGWDSQAERLVGAARRLWINLRCRSNAWRFPSSVSSIDS